MPLKLYNTLTKSLEPFTPQDPDHIRFYTCGPTVYDDAHIGNFRSFLAADLLRRWLESPLCTLEKKNKELHHGPRQVTHVMNITDVGHMTDDDNADGAGEDKMDVAARRILEAKKSGTLPPDANVDPNNPFQIAQFYEARFKADAKALGMKVAIDAEKDPSLMPRATGNIKEMKQVIEDLLKKGDAYAAGSPGARAIYFDVQKFDRYGKLSGNTLDQLKGGAGGRVDDTNTQQKHHPADFLLWKEDASHKMKWPSPKVPGQDAWGDGYPGWHIECTAMALGRLIPGGLNAAKAKHAHIDLHSGGEDNIFPHHECEIAQSCCFTGAQQFASHWFHPRFLKVDGQKMSKSKGTMHTLRDLTKANNDFRKKPYEASAVRLELIKTHYRTNADFSRQGLVTSEKRIRNWRRLVRGILLTQKSGTGTLLDAKYVWEQELKQAIRYLDNDLNVTGLISVLDTWYKRDLPILVPEVEDGAPEDDFDRIQLPDAPMSPEDALEQMNKFQATSVESLLGAIHLIDNILGVIFRPVEKAQDTGIALYQPGVTPSDEIESLLQQRADAKKSKDFAAADAIRDQLAALGLSIMDKPGGKVEVAIAN